MNHNTSLVKACTFLTVAVASTVAAFATGIAPARAQAAPAAVADPTAMTATLQQASRPAVTRNLQYGPLSQQKIDIYMPSRAYSLPRPVVVLVHGGSFVRGDKAGYQPDFTPMMLNAGFIVANMDYRLGQNGGPTREMLNDMQLAVRWLRSNARHLGIESSRMCLNGFSSGGTLAVATGALHSIYPGDMANRLPGVPVDVQCVVSNSSPVTMDVQGSGQSVLSLVSHQSSPMLVTNGTHDPIVSIQQAYALVRALQHDNVAAQTIYYDGGHVLSGLNASSKNNVRSREILYMKSKLAP